MTNPRARLLFASLGLLLLAGGARASGLASSSEEDAPRANHRGLYAALGGGGILQLLPGASGPNANTFGYDFEARLGYSFSPQFQLYLSGNYDAAAHDTGLGSSVTLTNNNFMINLQTAFYADRQFTVYGRIGLGLGIVGSNDGTASQKGLGEIFGIGFDIRLTNEISLAPEVFYRRSDESSADRVDSLGLQLNLVYY